METDLAFTNPRTRAEIDDWPFGRQRCRAVFQVEHKGDPYMGRERVARWTENKTRTGWNRPKYTTYGRRACIVDGSDSKTYILILTEPSASVAIHSGDMKHIVEYVRVGDPRYAILVSLFAEVTAPVNPDKTPS